MAKNPKKYWIYAHDVDGELIENIADEDFLTDAIDKACEYFTTHDSNEHTVHVVDDETQVTVWIAGPGNSIKQTDA